MNPYESEIDMAYEQGIQDADNDWEEKMATAAADEAEQDYYWYKLYRDAIETFGVESQITKCIEECAELIQALCKRDHDNTIEEIVDVEICLEQMKTIFINDAKSSVLYCDMIRYKRERLQERIDNE